MLENKSLKVGVKNACSVSVIKQHFCGKVKSKLQSHKKLDTIANDFHEDFKHIGH